MNQITLSKLDIYKSQRTGTSWLDEMESIEELVKTWRNVGIHGGFK
jgi:hypothetical protein